jgi:hypothetical protein
MDLYINNLSTDLCDSNNESSNIASKVLGDILSKYLIGAINFFSSSFCD